MYCTWSKIYAERLEQQRMLRGAFTTWRRSCKNRQTGNPRPMRVCGPRWRRLSQGLHPLLLREPSRLPRRPWTPHRRLQMRPLPGQKRYGCRSLCCMTRIAFSSYRESSYIDIYMCLGNSECANINLYTWMMELPHGGCLPGSTACTCLSVKEKPANVARNLAPAVILHCYWYTPGSSHIAEIRSSWKANSQPPLLVLCLLTPVCAGALSCPPCIWASHYDGGEARTEHFSTVLPI